MSKSTVYSQVFDEYLANAADPAWRMAFEIALGEWMGEIAAAHQGPIQAIADRAVIRSLDKTRDDITKRFLLTRLEEIRKERTFDPAEHPRDKEGQWARKGTGRSQSAGFADLGEAMAANLGNKTKGVPGSYSRPTSQLRRNQAFVVDQRMQEAMRDALPEDRVQTALGATVQPVTLRAGTTLGDHQAEVLTEAAAMTYALSQKTLNSKDKQKIQYTISGPRGTRVVVPSDYEIPDDIDWAGGERIRWMVPVGPDHPATVAGKVMDIGLVAGLDRENAAKAGSVVADIHDTLNTTDWGRRLTNVANVARVVGNGNPVVAQAHAVAGLINILGPDAARAFGPKMRQLSYRYTGQEAHSTQMAPVAAGGRQPDSKGELESTEAFERKLMVDLTHSLPKATEYKAALQAGTTPPSKGYLLDKNGKVITESVGFADDWYTPFNLKRLPKLKNGSYVRTRSYGGLTSEDIQLAMHTGAQRVTVVSNSGVFTIEFDNRVRSSGHRFGYGGIAMQRRYAKSLDAIKNARVDGPDNQPLKLDLKGYGIALQDLKNKYPYFVKSVKVEPPINASAVAPGRTPPGTPEPHAEDKGYVRPLSIKATGAKAGWADDSVEGERKGYDQLADYQLRKTHFGALVRDVQKAGAKDTGDTVAARIPGAAAVASDPVAQRKAQEAAERIAREARGEGKTVSAYQQEHVLDPDTAGQHMRTLKDVIQHDATRSSNQEDVAKLIEVLGSADKKGSDYKAVRDKWAADPDFRTRVVAELGDVYPDSPDVALLPGLASATADPSKAASSDADPDAPDDMAALDDDGFYEPHMRIPKASIMESLAIRSWLQDLRIQADPGMGGDARAERQLAAFDAYIEVSETDVRNRNNAARDALNPADRNTFDRMHERVIQKLNHERGKVPDDEPEEVAEIPPPPPRQRLETPEGATRAMADQAREIITSADEHEARLVGTSIIENIVYGDLPPEDVIPAMETAIDRFEAAEADMRRMGKEDFARKMAAAVEAMRDEALNYEVKDE